MGGCILGFKSFKSWNVTTRAYVPIIIDYDTSFSEFFSVSIPQKALDEAYKVKPHRRRSFDATDSCALSKVSFDLDQVHVFKEFHEVVKQTAFSRKHLYA